MACNQRLDDMDAGTLESERGTGIGLVTLGDVVGAVIEVSQSEREAVAVVVHLLESGQVVRTVGPRKPEKPRRRQRAREGALRKTA